MGTGNKKAEEGYKNQGYTLIEIILSLAILCIVVVIALTALSSHASYLFSLGYQTAQVFDAQGKMNHVIQEPNGFLEPEVIIGPEMEVEIQLKNSHHVPSLSMNVDVREVHVKGKENKNRHSPTLKTYIPLY